MSSRITDQKLKNQRFRKTEETIIVNYCLLKGNLNVRKLIKTAQISHSTFYRHHCSIHEIVPSYEQYILRKYKNLINKELKNKSARLPHLFRKTMIFLAVHQKIIQFLLDYGDHNIIETILFYLSPKLLATGKITNQAMLEIYLKEISTLIEQWGRGGFNKDEILTVTDKIIYLTDTVHIRLGPVTN